MKTIRKHDGGVGRRGLDSARSIALSCPDEDIADMEGAVKVDYIDVRNDCMAVGIMETNKDAQETAVITNMMIDRYNEIYHPVDRHDSAFDTDIAGGGMSDARQSTQHDFSELSDDLRVSMGVA